MPSEDERRQIRERQGNRCYYCNEPLSDGGDNSATLDHFIPRSYLKGTGIQLADNFVYACLKCNQSKADKVPVGGKELRGGGRRAGNWQLTDFGNWKWVGQEVDSDIKSVVELKL